MRSFGIREHVPFHSKAVLHVVLLFIMIAGPHLRGFPRLPTLRHTFSSQLKLHRTTTAGFEPAHPEDNRFLVCRLNHSATLSVYSVLRYHNGICPHASSHRHLNVMPSSRLPLCINNVREVWCASLCC
ncbi:hypothetical protein BC830DRAFT_221758 [Chytriomyces sp. MP71]|nr:hypothetical protein BC830DRAFT_221758 [Chytriomyces sp. MP71]